MKAINNSHDVSLPLAVWAVQDDYDYISRPNYISATSLMKPVRQIILPKRISEIDRPQEDVEDYIARSLGNSLHASVEKVWTSNYAINMKKLGYPDDVIARVILNPTDDQLKMIEEPIPVYIEQRMFRKLDDYVIGGKFDMLTDGILNDLKSTSAYKWMLGDNTEYQIQGSIYRWLDAKGYTDVECKPEHRFKPRITEDYIRINFIFTDWQKMLANGSKGYPPRRAMHKDIPLMSLPETENFLRTALHQIERFKDAPEKEIPECTDEELWRSETVYKYYANPAKTSGRSTRNFSTMQDAHQHLTAKGGVGIIKTVPGEPKRCGYCPAFDACTQKDRYL